MCRFRSRPKNFGPAISESRPGQGLRGGMATTWLADRFSENSEARTRLRNGTCFCAGRRSGPRQVGPFGHHRLLLYACGLTYDMSPLTPYTMNMFITYTYICR